MKKQTFSDQKLNSGIRSLLVWSIPILFGILTLAACIKSVIYGMDIDESYAVSCAYRMLKGDRLLADLWEPHQFASVYLVPILAIWLKITGSTTGIIVYSRIVGLLLHILVGILVLLPFRKSIRKDLWILLLLIHINFLPKWVQLPEFELLQYWFLLLLSLCFYRYLASGTRKDLFLSGLFLFAQLLCYPSLILLYPVLLGMILWQGRKRARNAGAILRDSLTFTGGAAIPGILFLCYLLSYQSPSELVANLGRLSADPAHSMSLLQRLAQETDQLLIMFLVTAGLIVAALLLRKYCKKALLPASFFCIAAMSVIHLCILAFTTENQFAFLWRYLAVVAFCGICLPRSEGALSEETDRLRLAFVLPGLCSGFCILLITNMYVNVTMAKVFSACFGILLMLAAQISASPDSGKIFFRHFLPRWAFALFALSLLFPRALMNRVTGCVRNIVWSDTTEITAGPAKGIRMRTDLGLAMNQDQLTLSQYLTGDDSLLIISNESLLYLMSDAAISGASTQGTSTFNEMFLDYLELHPDKYPTAVAVDKMLGIYPYYFNPAENSVLLTWIQEEFPYTETVETDYLTLYLIR